MKYQVSLNGKQFEVEVEKGSVSAVPTGAAPAPAPAAAAPAPAAAPDRCSAHAGHHSGYPMHGRSGR